MDRVPACSGTLCPAHRTGVELWNGLLLAWPLALALHVGGQLAGTGGRNTLQEYAVLYFAFVVPLLTVSRKIRDPKWRQGFLLTIGLLLFGGVHREASAYPLLDVLSGVLVFGVAGWIYMTHGLMGALAASAAGGLTSLPVFAGLAFMAAPWLGLCGFASRARR